MKKLILMVLAIVVIYAGFVFAKKYDLSQISQAKLVGVYSEETLIDDVDTVTFGAFYQNNASNKSPIEWIMLDRQGDKALLLSKYILYNKSYNDSLQVIMWKDCTLRKWLNDTFYNAAFNVNEQSCIETTNVINVDNEKYETSGGDNTSDKIFCLSIDEARKYFGDGTKDETGYKIGKIIATKGTKYAKAIVNNGRYLEVKNSEDWSNGNSFFWLRSPGSLQDYASYGTTIGHIMSVGVQVNHPRVGVRPALWINYKKLNDKSK